MAVSPKDALKIKPTIKKDKVQAMQAVEQAMEPMQVFYGEAKCQFEKRACTNGAYWSVGNKLLCGVHAQPKKKNRQGSKPVALPKRSAKSKKAREEQLGNAREADIQQAQRTNQESKKPGKVALYRMRMLKSVERLPGFKVIYPNNKHGNKKDGYGCPALSPMRLGPVKHGQPGLPDALNIENLHQGSKCFQQELDPDSKEPRPGPLYYENRLKFYQDPVPHRHKYPKNDSQGNASGAQFSVWVDQQGKEHYLTYVQSRQIYSCHYEVLAKQTAEFKQLQEWRAAGMNLQIAGYDAFDLEEWSPAGFDRAYLDPKKPFGHERVLAALLFLEPKDYPWRVHQTLHLGV